ncbi:MAG: hypothetical protein SPL71_12860, partial [Oribacterium sp.]|nr:hypothetical protein [Oribacterium sp.]
GFSFNGPRKSGVVTRIFYLDWITRLAETFGFMFVRMPLRLPASCIRAFSQPPQGGFGLLYDKSLLNV